MFNHSHILPPPQALNNKADMLFDAHTVDIEISAGEDKLLILAFPSSPKYFELYT